MKWIYAELRDVNDYPIASYRINPKYVMAVNLNEQKLIIKDFEHPLYYTEGSEELILKLIGVKEKCSD